MAFLKSKYSRNKPKTGRGRNQASHHYDHRKQSHSQKTDLDSIINHVIESTGNTASIYGVQTLANAKRIFGDDKFHLYQHIKDVFRETSTGDVPDLIKYLQTSKSLTSDFLSKKVKNQYVEFISMSRNVLEIEDQMSEMDDMLKTMSVSLKSLHETKFKMLERTANALNSTGIDGDERDAEEERDREKQEMQVLESMHEQILQHIQLRELQQATDLIVTARNEHFHLKPSARKRAAHFINTHIHELRELIVEQLSTSSYLPEMKRDKLSTLLMKLGFVDEAMELFLAHKSKTLKHNIRQISLYGDVKQYIEDLSKVFFDFIINSTIQYTNLLGKIEIEIENAASDAMSLNPFDNLDIDEEKERDRELQRQREELVANSQHFSRLIVWIYAELEGYETLFGQQVFQLEQNDHRTIGECLKIVFKQSTRLDLSGIHVSFLLSNHFEPSIEAAINRLYKKKLESIKRLKRRENYLSKSKNVSNASHGSAAEKQRIIQRLSIYSQKLQKQKQHKRMSLLPAENPFAHTERRRSAARFSRINKHINETKHQRRTSEIFGNVNEIKEEIETDAKIEEEPKTEQSTTINQADQENRDELRRLTHHRRLSKTMIEEQQKQKHTLAPPNASSSGSRSGSNSAVQYTVVKLTKSGQEMYEIVKKCIQETWRLLDQRYYSELTKSVYKTVVTQMIYLVQVYSSQICDEINEKAPKQLTMYRKRKTGARHNKYNRHKAKQRSSNKTVPTIMENEQFEHGTIDVDDEKGTNNGRSTSSGRSKTLVLNEVQMLSLIANVFYVSEDLLRRIAHRYQKLFGRPIPELQLFVIEQQKLYNALFPQFAKKFLYKWVHEKLLWKNDRISSIYSEKSDISIITKEEMTKWTISKEMLDFVRYIVDLRLKIDKYLGSNKDIVMLRDSIAILLDELLNGGYIPIIDAHHNGTDESVWISPFGLNKLYLDFRFLSITLSNFLTEKSKKMITSICEKAKKYVNHVYNLKISVDWKMMHSMAMKLQYKALTGDELDILNKAFLAQNESDDNNNTSAGNKTQPKKRDSSKMTSKKVIANNITINSKSSQIKAAPNTSTPISPLENAKNKNNPFV